MTFLPTQYVNTPLPAKIQRRSSKKGGNIHIDFDANVADSLQLTIGAAADFFASLLPIGTNVGLSVALADIENDMEVSVIYTLDSLYSYPTSLYKNILNKSYNNDNYDATIKFSENASWACGIGSTIRVGEKSLATAMLRAISIALGFGTTISQIKGNNNTDIIVFNTGYGTQFSIFETLVFNNNGTSLTSVNHGSKKRNNAELINYMQNTDTMWVVLDSAQYQLYNPTPFVKNKSMIFLDEPSSLMHYQIPEGHINLSVDEITRSILKEIGWPLDVETTENDIEIQCSTIPSTGIASAYATYTFTLNNYTSNVTNTSWKYMVKHASGEYVCVSQQTGGQTFQIMPSSVNANTAYINADGDMEGIIQYTYTRSGREYTALYKLTLEYKPTIWGVYNQKSHFGPYANLYNYSFSVSYAGAESLTIGVEQEYSAGYDTYYIYEPYWAHAYVTNLNCGNMVWVDISATNSYGSTMYTIEIPEQTLFGVKEERLVNSQENAYAMYKIAYVDVHSLNGKLLRRVHSMSEISGLHNGIYILGYHDEKGNLINTRTIHLNK